MRLESRKRKDTGHKTGVLIYADHEPNGYACIFPWRPERQPGKPAGDISSRFMNMGIRPFGRSGTENGEAE